MKKLLFLIYLIYSASITSQTVTSTCLGPDSIVKKYIGTANQLAVRKVYEINSTYKDSISIDKTLRNNYLRALIAVYNATALPARDTVIDMYNIQPYNPIVNNVLVQADSNLQWMKNLRANAIPTGYITIDSLMTMYYLKKTFYSTWITPNANVVLRTDTNCNTQQLAKFIKNLPGVATAQEDFLFGDGNNIEDSLTNNYTWLVYSHGWGDCPNGCYYRRFWQFRVYNDCSVEYGGSFGVPLTVGIKENELSDANFKVFPNPFNEELNIEIQELNNVYVVVANILGEEVLKYKVTQDKTQLNTSSYPPGVYMIQLISNNRLMKTTKLVKP